VLKKINTNLVQPVFSGAGGLKYRLWHTDDNLPRRKAFWNSFVKKEVLDPTSELMIALISDLTDMISIPQIHSSRSFAADLDALPHPFLSTMTEYYWSQIA